ncbi:MAG: DNA translocase FtsK 4TM domain-containing protein, partial [Victivallales bacterium]
MAGENEEKVTTFKLRYVICGIALLLFLLSIFSYNKADLTILDGGSAEPLRNWVGPLGANISRALFYIFGLAVYPITSLMIICLARGFIPYPLKRRGYIMALCVTILGIVILLALF